MGGITGGEAPTGAGILIILRGGGGGLFGRGSSGLYEIPGGMADPGEDPAATARREFEEEVGIAAPNLTANTPCVILVRGARRFVLYIVAVAAFDLAGVNAAAAHRAAEARAGRLGPQYAELSDFILAPTDTVAAAVDLRERDEILMRSPVVHAAIRRAL